MLDDRTGREVDPGRRYRRLWNATSNRVDDEAVAYAERLRDAGVRCELEVVTGTYHGFDAVAPGISVAQHFYAGQLSALRRALHAH
jgi:acetyl esterase/lipase